MSFLLEYRWDSPLLVLCAISSDAQSWLCDQSSQRVYHFSSPIVNAAFVWAHRGAAAIGGLCDW